MYLRIFTIFLLGFFSIYCGGGGGSSSSTNDNAANENASDTVTNSIAGTWLLPYPGIEDCIERYTFDNDGGIEVVSGSEITTGIYTFEDTVNVGERHALFIQLSNDNRAPDCAGDSVDDTGLALTTYLIFNSATVIDWYTDANGGQFLVTMTKE